ncbi:MAG: helix-turn-helix transcriptional regulator [Phycisphaeraceae bacterium]|nr:helix-turn-helix transcriptional regulator [Phycisphaeraceae bacterium]
MSERDVLRDVRRRVRVFAALGDDTRLSILSRLRDGRSMSIAALSKGRSVTRQSVSKHLAVLEDAGLVRSVRHGRENRFALVPRAIDDAARSLESISRQWDSALLRLKERTEAEQA